MSYRRFDVMNAVFVMSQTLTIDDIKSEFDVMQDVSDVI